MAVLESKMILKLLIDSGNNKVLFAEAGKDFVDFMFSLLLLPLGSLIKLITPQITAGSIGKLYQSVENINDTYLVANLNKSTLLQPTVSALAGSSPLLLTGFVGTPVPKKSHYRSYSTSGCNVNYGAENEGASVEGFVKGVVTYMITDDLEVTPLSAISSINRFILKKNVRLEEKAVVIGMKEGIALLAASFQSATALTDVFLNTTTKKKAVINRKGFLNAAYNGVLSILVSLACFLLLLSLSHNPWSMCLGFFFGSICFFFVGLIHGASITFSNDV